MGKIMERNLVLLLIIACAFTVMSMSGNTYALYVNKNYGTTEDYTTGLLDLTFDENTTLTLASAFPISDAEGESSDAYSLKITNTGNLTYKFNVELLDTTSENLINNKYIKIKIDDGDIHTLDTSNILSKDVTLVPGESKKISVRMWLSEDTPNSEAGKGFSAKATTNGHAVYTTGTEKPKTAADTIMELSKGDSWPADLTDSGVYATNSYTASDGTTKYHDYRYVGANVNNWVSFNNDLYRIIGVFDENSHGVEGEYLVKLIMDSPLGGYSWGVYNTDSFSGIQSGYSNDWTGKSTTSPANLNILLNEYFYNKKDISSTYGDCVNWTYFSFHSNVIFRTNDCADIRGYGIDSKLMNYIENVIWYLYGSDTNQSKQNWYLCERGGNFCTSSGSSIRDTSVISKIGLMYPSDFLYASGYYSNIDTTVGNVSYFGYKNWLSGDPQWIITPNVAITAGKLASTSSSTSFSSSVHPVFYLKSDVKISGGFGTYNNPYTLEQG